MTHRALAVAFDNPGDVTEIDIDDATEVYGVEIDDMGEAFVPCRVTMLSCGTVKTEKSLHAQFASLRVRGEWFRADPVLLGFIDQINAIEISRMAVSDADLRITLPVDGET